MGRREGREDLDLDLDLDLIPPSDTAWEKGGLKAALFTR
jgi:hypothetical protein